MADPTMKKSVHIAKIIREHRNACEKHPKFCDEFTSLSKEGVEAYERYTRFLNSKSPYYAESILQEEIAEALSAHQQGDREHCLQELAQCGAVILRMMQYVEEERWANGDTCKKEEK